ncbi:MAG: 5-bromo-4-chloroindolyl phosphate hydrolysis family protein [Schaedlerella sp.]|nr:5-bromo-4-chloroindolyl phosphate hydrolysis family protein [Schaedlerella sp.]
MNNRDWEIFGKEICRNVQDAIDSRDFSKLNQTINDTISGAADEIGRGIKKAVNAQQNRHTTYGNYQYRQQNRYGSGPQYGQYSSGMNSQQNYSVQKTQKYSLAKGYNTQLYSSGAFSIAGGVVLTVTGGCLGLGSLITILSGLAVTFVDYASVIGVPITGLGGILLLISMALLGVGIKKIKKAKRFRSYVKLLGYKEYGNIRELAEKVNKSVKFVKKDIEKMIRQGWFRQGHLDKQKTCLITSNEAYQQYSELEVQRKNLAEQQQRAAREAELKKKAQEEATANLSPEVKEVIRAGEEYVRIIRACNDAIPGEEVSDKIYKIEKVVDSIFDWVESNPESVSDLHRMMEYYLPTTVKLLKAYESLDAEPVQGENILSSKREIEKTLDTLNIAFEKLLDSLFEETAWDLSSDISVLNTMLAQEGLTEEHLKK